MVNENDDLRKKAVFLSIIIPVYNEAKRIHNLKEVVEYCNSKSDVYEIIVVDDGSTDETSLRSAEILNGYNNYKILASDKNYGKGHAVAAGMKEASGQYHLFMDVDLSTPLTHIDDAIREIDKCDIVIGTRKNAKASLIKRQPWLRENLGKVFTFLSSLILNTWLSDFTCGFKLFTREASNKIFGLSKVDRWAFDSEIMYLARKLGYRVCELPVTWINDLDTRVNVRNIIFSTLKDLTFVRMREYPEPNKTAQFVKDEVNADSVKEKPRSFFHKRISISWFVIILISFVLLLRILVFLKTQDVGIEHDSAWYLGVAKNLASRGIYASFTNTSINEDEISPSIHSRISVQDKQGFTYFPAGVTVGPGYVMPQAMLMKVFGFGYWQYRMFPLFGYFIFTFLLLWIVLTSGGYFSLFIFSVWLWMRPDFTISQSFEAYSEHISLVYLLISLKLISDIKRTNLDRKKLFLGGLFLGLSVMTKSLNLLSVPGILLLICSYESRFWENLIFFIRKLLYLLLGYILPVSLFEIYKYAFLLKKFGKVGYNSVNLDALLTLRSGGSGIGTAEFSSEFILAKLNFWQNNSTVPSILVWSAFLCLGIIFAKHIRKSSTLPFAIWLTALSQFLWFVIFSQTGWYRHVWQASLLAMLLFSVAANIAYKRLSSNIYVLTICTFAALYVFISTYENGVINGFLISKSDINVKWASNFIKTPNGLQSQIFSPIFSWKDTYELSRYIGKEVDVRKKIYYFQSFLVTEAATMSERIFYSSVRMASDKDKQVYVLIGPYQKGELSLLAEDYYKSFLQYKCNEIAYENPSYTLCKVQNDTSLE